jgi:DNA-binding transcriptional LysR family regulator
VAEALHQSPSAISQQLSTLEREVGVQLLRRVGRGVQLTAQAEVLVDHTAVVLERLERAEADLYSSLKEASGTVRVAVFQSAALALLPQTLQWLGSAHPRLRVTMTQHEPEEALQKTWASEFDLVIAEQYPGHAAPRHPELDRVRLTTDSIRLAVPNTDRSVVDVQGVEDTRDLAWVMEPRGAASRHWAEQACRSAGFEPDVRYETADLQAHLALIESGNAVALVPDLMTVRSRPNVRLISLEGSPKRTIFTAARRASRGNPGIKAVRDALSRVVLDVRALSLSDQ